MFLKKNRIEREKETIGRMLEIYCYANHGSNNALCSDCSDLYDYVMKKLNKCPYVNEKPACTNCPVHCYNKKMKENIRQVMRFSGPRMITRHPLLAIIHIIDKKLYGTPDLKKFSQGPHK